VNRHEEATMAQEQIQPVRCSVEVELSQPEAFEFFTAHISRWWPLATHSVAQQDTETAVFELGAGGEIFELAKQSERIVWGTVLNFEPPERVVFSWHPGQDPSSAQEVEVRFHELGGRTRVELEHRGWDRLGEKAEETRNTYLTGWEHVLGTCYREGTLHRD
jgi:uncharacterized protein YndB with AHSA1/START domain